MTKSKAKQINKNASTSVSQKSDVSSVCTDFSPNAWARLVRLVVEHIPEALDELTLEVGKNADELDGAQQTIAGMSSALGGFENELKAIKVEIQALDARVEALENKE